MVNAHSLDIQARQTFAINTIIYFWKSAAVWFFWIFQSRFLKSGAKLLLLGHKTGDNLSPSCRLCRLMHFLSLTMGV